MTTSAETSLVKEGDLLVGKYRVERVLGVGGMGVVVAAMHVDLDQRVALKFLLPELAQNAEAVERFLREARAAVRLRSEHAAKVLDVGKLETGAPYIVMEYLDGADLSSVIEAARPTIPQAVEYVLQACEAIAEAHALGIVHRDLKPQNLFLTRRVHGAPLVKVLDFGISKAVAPSGVRDMTLTKTGIVMGSPLYMSPEQMKSGRLADHRSDLWALGVILYQLLTGGLPFEAETVPHLCAMIMTEQPRLPQLIRPEIPVGLQSVVLRCLEKDPNKRYQNVAELAWALEPFAPPSARGAAGRISNVLHVPAGETLMETSTAPTEPKERITAAVSAATMQQSQTAVEWSESKQATTMHRLPKHRIFVIGGVAAALVVGVIAIFVARSGSTSGTSTQASESNAAPKTTTSAATTEKSTVAPTPPPTTTDTPVATTQPPTPPPSETAKPTATATVKTTTTAKTPLIGIKPPTVKASASTGVKPPPASTKTGPDLFGDQQ